MREIFKFRDGQPTVWFSRDLAESNQHCLYCGRLVGIGASIQSDREHLIGRNFVPAGYLDGNAFNFIFRACLDCNAAKGDAERHISSVTLFNSIGRGEDDSVDSLALHKASRDYHPITRSLVQDSFTDHETHYDLGALKMTFKNQAPPQLNPNAVLLLAGRQVQALFALMTTEDARVAEKSRFLPACNVLVLDDYSYRDWGNPHLLELDRRTRSWQRPAILFTARGYFKATFRRVPAPEDGYFWALEWNKSVRIVGGICDATNPPGWLTSLPPLKWWSVPSPRGRAWMRRETPLPEDADTLFSEEPSPPAQGPSPARE